MPDTVSIKCTNPELDCDNLYGQPLKMTVNWTCDATGDVKSWLANEYSASLLSNFGDFVVQPSVFKGYINRIITTPATTATPTDHYDVYLKVANSTSATFGVDLLQANGADRSATYQQAIQFSSDTRVHSELFLRIINAGANKKGQVDIFMSGK